MTANRYTLYRTVRIEGNTPPRGVVCIHEMKTIELAHVTGVSAPVAGPSAGKEPELSGGREAA